MHENSKRSSSISFREWRHSIEFPLCDKSLPASNDKERTFMAPMTEHAVNRSQLHASAFSIEQ
jgi:hypothetical protein